MVLTGLRPMRCRFKPTATLSFIHVRSAQLVVVQFKKHDQRTLVVEIPCYWLLLHRLFARILQKVHDWKIRTIFRWRLIWCINCWAPELL